MSAPGGDRGFRAGSDCASQEAPVACRSIASVGEGKFVPILKMIFAVLLLSTARAWRMPIGNIPGGA